MSVNRLADYLDHMRQAIADAFGLEVPTLKPKTPGSSRATSTVQRAFA